MYFVLPTSLKKQTLMTIAIALWEHYLDPVSRKCFQRNCNHFRQVKHKLVGHVQKLVLPRILKTELTTFVDGVGSQLLRFFRLVRAVCEKDVDASAIKIFWTAHGTVNLKKTVDAVVQDETIPAVYRYKLAYICCLEDQITNLWRQLDTVKRREYPNKLDGQYCLLDSSRKANSEFGSDCYNADMPPYKHGLYHSVLNGIDISVKYYLQKLAEDEEGKEILRKNTFYLFEMVHAKYFDEAPSHILCYLLNGMDEEYQKKLFEKYPYDVLLLLLNWPAQVYFLKLLQCVGSSLSRKYFYELLNGIILKRLRGYQDYDYGEAFQQVWKLSSVGHRRYAVERYATFANTDDFNPCCIFELQDWKIFNLVLEDATSKVRKRIIFHQKMCDAYRKVIIRGSHSVIECFVKECLVSRKEILELKKKMGDRCAWYQRRKKFRRFNSRWDNFFTLIDGLINNKRKCTFENGNRRKKRRVAKR